MSPTRRYRITAPIFQPDTMKIIQLTDLHLVGHNGTLGGVDPLKRLHLCLEDIRTHHGDAEFCVLTGDLADRGNLEAYDALHGALETLPMPCHLMLGNHDNRDTFARCFPETPRDSNGYIQSSTRQGGADFLFLDTNETQTHSGSYGKDKLIWLQDRLAASQNRPVYLFMHHPFFDIGIPSLDQIKLKNPDALGAVLQQAGNIKHIFMGHVHRPISGSWHSIPFSTLPALHRQVPFDLQTTDHVPANDDPPAYGVIFINDEQTTVHVHSFLG